MIPLYEKCPELGKQIIGFTLKDEEGLPDGDYVLMESFCDNPDCDCRNAFIYITTAPPEVKNMAGINYGWEEQTSARKKIGRNDSCPCGSGKKYKMCCGR
jgi:hypothetical protein